MAMDDFDIGEELGEGREHETEELAARVATMIEACDADADGRRERRLRALEYYHGRMSDMPPGEGKSQVVSRDFRATVAKIMPAIMRVFFGSDEIAEFQPVGEGDDAQGEEMTLYFNNVVAPEGDLEEAVYDAFQDAMKHGEGVIKWFWDERKCVSIETRTGLMQDQLEDLASQSDIEIIEQWDDLRSLDGQEDVTVYGVRFKRTYIDRKARAAAVPPDEFGIHPEAKNAKDAPFVYHRTQVTKSDLVARGYDRDLVESLPLSERSIDSDQEHAARINDDGETLLGSATLAGGLETVELYECYIRYDADGDGIDELRRVDYIASNVNKILFDDYASEIQFEVLTPERIEHTAKGHSVFDDVEEIQRVKTALIRQSQDNLYWSNMPQPTVQEGAVMNPDAVVNPQFGLPIRVRTGTDIRAAIGYNPVPFVAQHSYAMIDRWDAALVDRTGITAAAAGLDPNALQNVREQGVQMISDAAAARAWCIARALAKGIKRVCGGMMRLVVENQDHPRMMRLAGKPMSFDPRGWTMEFDCTPNTGLGTGTRERDMAALLMVANYQEKVLATMGINNPFVKPEHMHNTFSQLVKVAGLKTPAMFFARPTPEEIAAMNQPKPTPEQEKLAAEKEMKIVEMQAQRDKERAQAEADLVVGDKKLAADEHRLMIEGQIKVDIEQMRIAFEREKFTIENATRLREAEMKREIEMMRIGAATAGEAGVSTQEIVEAVSQLAGIVQSLHAAMNAPRRLVIDPVTGDPIGSEIVTDGMAG